MKLSAIVSYLNHLNNLSVGEEFALIHKSLEPIVHKVSTHDLQFGNFSDRLVGLQQDINRSLGLVHVVVEDLKKEIQKNIEQLEVNYLQQSYELYDQGMKNDSVEIMLNRRPILSPDVHDYIKARIRRHNDWHYPGMIIRPGVESWIQDLVALDPIYIVDVDRDMFEPSLAQFPPEYQNRVRRVIIKESTEVAMLAHLPQQQLSFILAYNYFNYKPIEMIKCFLQEIFNCLRPGGTFAFTFNDCDRAGGVELVERYYMCYTPGRLVLAAATMVGFEHIHSYHMDAAITWCELKKPGNLHNLRGGQSLARTIAKPKINQ
jgi:hypothetical protein